MATKKNGLLSIRLMKQNTRKNEYGETKKTKNKKTGEVKTTRKVYRSFINQFLHDFRYETMEDNYLVRPEEFNKKMLFEFEEKYSEYNLSDTDDKENLEKIPQLFIQIKKDYQKKHNRKLHKQTKPSLNFLISFESEFDLSEENRQAQYESVERFIKKNFDFPIYLVQHNDEKSLHYTFSVMNFDKDLKPIAKKIDTFYLQDMIADHLQEEGQDYGHKRGITKDISGAEHKGIVESKVKDAETKIEQLETQIEKLQKENSDLKTDFQKTINQIILGLEQLNEQTTIDSFLKTLARYLKGNKKEKIEKLILKNQKILNKKNKEHNQKVSSSNIDYVNESKQSDTNTTTTQTTTNKG